MRATKHMHTSVDALPAAAFFSFADLVEISPVKLPAPGTTAPAFTRDEAAIALAIRCAIVKACQSAADAIVSLSTREERECSRGHAAAVLRGVNASG